MPTDQTVLPQQTEHTWMPRAVSATSHPIAQLLGTTAALAEGAGTSSSRAEPGQKCGRAEGHHSAQPGPAARGPARRPQAGTGWCSQPATISLPLQTPASVLLQPPCQAWHESPQADVPERGASTSVAGCPCVPQLCCATSAPATGEPGMGTITRCPPGCLACKEQQGRAAAAPILREQDGQTRTRCAGGCRRAPGARRSRVSSPARAAGSEVSRPRRAELFC